MGYLQRNFLNSDALRGDLGRYRGLLRQSLATHIGLAIFGLALALRLLLIAHENLWYDEAFTAWLARLHLPHMLAATAGDVHPPGWYSLEWLIVHLIGDSAFALRLPSALFGAWSVWLVWRIALSLGLERRIGALAGLLAAIMAGPLYYGQEARMYAALSAFMALMVLSAIQRRWRLTALSGIAVVYLHNLGLLYVACVVLALTWRAYAEADAKDLLHVVLIIGLAWVLWLPQFLAQARAIGEGWWMPPLSGPGVFLPLVSLTAGWRLADGFQLHVFSLIIAFSMVALYMSRRWLNSENGLILSAAIVGSPLVIAGISVLWRSVYLPRAMLPSITLLTIPFAFALVEWPISERRYVWTLVLPSLLVGLIANYQPVKGRMDIERFIAPIRENWQPGDIVYYTTNDAAIMAEYYLPGKDWAIFPESSDLSQSLTDATKKAMGFKVAEWDSLPSQGYRRAWVVLEDGALSSQAEIDYQTKILRSHPHWIVALNSDPVYSVSIALIDLTRPYGNS